MSFCWLRIDASGGRTPSSSAATGTHSAELCSNVLESMIRSTDLQMQTSNLTIVGGVNQLSGCGNNGSAPADADVYRDRERLCPSRCSRLISYNMKLLMDDGDGDGELSIKVNESYAKRFEHNKQREELHRLQEKHPEVATREQNKASRRLTRSCMHSLWPPGPPARRLLRVCALPEPRSGRRHCGRFTPGMGPHTTTGTMMTKRTRAPVKKR